MLGVALKPKQNSCFLFICSVVFWGGAILRNAPSSMLNVWVGAFQGCNVPEPKSVLPSFLCRLHTSQHVHYLVSPNPPMLGLLSAGFQDQGFNLASSLPTVQLLLHCLCSTARSCVARDAGMVLLWAQSGSLGKGRMTLSAQPLPWGHLTLLGWIRHTPVLLCPQ